MVLNAIGGIILVIGLAVIWGRWNYKDRAVWLTYTRPEAVLLAILLLLASSIGAYMSYEYGQDKAKVYTVDERQP